MAISKRNTDPECKQKRAEEYRLFIKEKRNETLYSFFSAYSKFSILIFFALILLARWVSLEKFYIVFPLFLGLHLLILFLFPAYFSFLPAYGQTRDEKEGFSACTFLLGPSVFSLFYFYRYTSIGFWLITLAVSIVLFALLLLRYRKEILAKISGTIVLEFLLLTLAIGGALVMIGFLTAPSHCISSEAVTVVEKTEQNNSYVLTLAFENGEKKPYYVSESVYLEADHVDVLYYEVYEGWFFVKTVQVTAKSPSSP
jgi:hypothetical protein